MNRLFNWTFGSVFRTIGRVIGYLLCGILLSLILSKNGIKITDLLGIERVNASTSIGVYAGYNGYSGSCSDSGYFNYDKLGTNVNGEIAWSKGAVNTAISGKAKNISLAFKYDLSANKTYDVTINFYSTDLTNKLKVSGFSVYKTLGCGDGRDYNDSTLSLLSFTNNASSSSNTNKLKFRISTLSVIGDWEVMLRGGDSYITSVNNFGIKSVTIDEVDTSGNNQVIENNNQNTQNVINNQNQNTEDIMNNQNQNTQNLIDNQNELMGTRCPNLINTNSIVAGDITGSATTLRAGTRNPIYLQAGTYHFKTNITSPWQYNLYVQNVGQPPLSSWPSSPIFDSGWQSGSTYTLTINSAGYLTMNLRKNDNGTIDLTTLKSFEYMLSKDNKPYCEYGSYSSKLDETTNSINDLNDSLNDDDTDGALSDAQDLFSDFEDDDFGLSGVITAPLNLIRSLTSKTCSPLVLPLPYMDNKNLTLPCLLPIYQENFNAILLIYQAVIFGLVGYRICVSIFFMVKGFKNPDEDNIEVMDL